MDGWTSVAGGSVSKYHKLTLLAVPTIALYAVSPISSGGVFDVLLISAAPLPSKHVTCDPFSVVLAARSL